jgi:hypothetical protein
MKNTSNIKQKRRPTKMRLLAFFALASFTYILSVGPVLSLAARVNCYGTPSYRFLRAFYSPVFAIAKSSDTSTRLYESYARMWCRFMLPPGSPGTEVPAIAAFLHHPTPETQSEFDRQERISELDGLGFSVILFCWMAGATLFVAYIWRSKQKIQQGFSDEIPVA